jgi:hypothetical protein
MEKKDTHSLLSRNKLYARAEIAKPLYCICLYWSVKEIYVQSMCVTRGNNIYTLYSICVVIMYVQYSTLIFIRCTYVINSVLILFDLQKARSVLHCRL